MIDNKVSIVIALLVIAIIVTVGLAYAVSTPPTAQTKTVTSNVAPSTTTMTVISGSETTKTVGLPTTITVLSTTTSQVTTTALATQVVSTTITAVSTLSTATVTSTQTITSTATAPKPASITITGTAVSNLPLTTADHIIFVVSPSGSTTYVAKVANGQYSFTLPNDQIYSVTIAYTINPIGSGSCNAGLLPLKGEMDTTITGINWAC